MSRLRYPETVGADSQIKILKKVFSQLELVPMLFSLEQVQNIMSHDMKL